MPLPQDVRFDPLHLMRMLGLDPDPWQAQVLQGPGGNLLLNCCRQAGKSTVVALHALLEALTQPRHLVLLLSASHRQSRELFGLVRGFWERLKAPFRGRVSATELCFKHGSRVVSLPCREDTIRGYSGVNLLIIDEAARVPDDLYRAVRPMLAVSGGRLICMSTPFGKRGFFYEAWTKGGDSWQRIEVPARAIPRIAASFLDEERRELGETAFRQEYCMQLRGRRGAGVSGVREAGGGQGAGRPGRPALGGLDFGYRNPCAAVWGTLDRADVLWLTGEHYERGRPLSHHAGHLPRDVCWYADPAAAEQCAELSCAGFTIRQASNPVGHGIAAVAARIARGRLRVVAGACPNLLAEAGLYRYPEGGSGGGENPLPEHNHALDALRYLVATHDARQIVRGRAVKPPDTPPAKPQAPENRWMRWDNPELWEDVGTIWK